MTQVMLAIAFCLVILALLVVHPIHIHCDTADQQYTPDREISFWLSGFRSIDADRACKDRFGPEFEYQPIGDHFH